MECVLYNFNTIRLSIFFRCFVFHSKTMKVTIFRTSKLSPFIVAISLTLFRQSMKIKCPRNDYEPVRGNIETITLLMVKQLSIQPSK